MIIGSSCTHNWRSLSRYLRIGTWSRIPIEKLFEVLIWIEAFHCGIERLHILFFFYKSALLTWKSSWSWHFRIKACVLIEASTTLRLCLWSMKNSICRLWGWNCPLFINYNTDSPSGNSGSRSHTIDQVRYLFKLLWGYTRASWFLRMSRRQSPSWFWSWSLLKALLVMNRVLIASYYGVTSLFSAHLDILTLKSWIILIVVPSHEHHLCRLLSCRWLAATHYSKGTLPIKLWARTIHHPAIGWWIDLWRGYLIRWDTHLSVGPKVLSGHYSSESPLLLKRFLAQHQVVI